jgi:cell division protease FtsH
MHANLSVSMGGRVAEELIFGHDKVSSGASSDIQYATSLARNMVTKWGMSDKLGPLQYEEQGEGYLGYGANQRVLMSDETSKLIDSEIRGLIDGAHARATKILKTNAKKLHLLAEALLEYETLNGDEIKELLDKGKIDRPDVPKGPATPAPVRGSSIPKTGKRFTGPGAAPQGV